MASFVREWIKSHWQDAIAAVYKRKRTNQPTCCKKPSWRAELDLGAAGGPGLKAFMRNWGDVNL